MSPAESPLLRHWPAFLQECRRRQRRRDRHRGRFRRCAPHTRSLARCWRGRKGDARRAIRWSTQDCCAFGKHPSQFVSEAPSHFISRRFGFLRCTHQSFCHSLEWDSTAVLRVITTPPRRYTSSALSTSCRPVVPAACCRAGALESRSLNGRLRARWRSLPGGRRHADGLRDRRQARPCPTVAVLRG